MCRKEPEEFTSSSKSKLGCVKIIKDNLFYVLIVPICVFLFLVILGPSKFSKLTNNDYLKLATIFATLTIGLGAMSFSLYTLASNKEKLMIDMVLKSGTPEKLHSTLQKFKYIKNGKEKNLAEVYANKSNVRIADLTNQSVVILKTFNSGLLLIEFFKVFFVLIVVLVGYVYFRAFYGLG